MKVQKIIKQEVKYTKMDKNGHISSSFLPTKEQAIEDANFDQPADRPYKIVKVIITYEDTGEYVN